MPKRIKKRLITGIRERLIETEPNMTDRLSGDIERDFEFDDRETLQSGITIKARTLRDRGRINRKVFMVVRHLHSSAPRLSILSVYCFGPIFIWRSAI